jgi:chromosome segregation ATPase
MEQQVTLKPGVPALRPWSSRPNGVNRRILPGRSGTQPARTSTDSQHPKAPPASSSHEENLAAENKELREQLAKTAGKVRLTHVLCLESQNEMLKKSLEETQHELKAYKQHNETLRLDDLKNSHKQTSLATITQVEDAGSSKLGLETLQSVKHTFTEAANRMDHAREEHELTKALEVKEKDIDNLKAQLAEKDKQVTQLTGDLDTVRNESELAKTDITIMKHRTESAEHDAEEAYGKYLKSQEDVTRLNALVKSLQSEIQDEAPGTRRGKDNQEAKQEEERCKWARERKQLEERVCALMKDKQGMQDAVSALREKNKALDDAVADMEVWKGRLAEATCNMKALWDEMEQLQGEGKGTGDCMQPEPKRTEVSWMQQCWLLVRWSLRTLGMDTPVPLLTQHISQGSS